jgi:hypothetical protein
VKRPARQNGKSADEVDEDVGLAVPIAEVPVDVQGPPADAKDADTPSTTVRDG